MRRAAVVGSMLVAAALLAALWWVRQTQRAENAPASPPAGGASGSVAFVSRPIGDPMKPEERPHISHVAVVDLDRDGLTDVLVCDAGRGLVGWIRQGPAGTFREVVVGYAAAPAHVETVDFDGDGDLDLVVAALGMLFPNNNRIGSVIVFEHDGAGRFRPHYIADRVARVADARAADLDGDGDMDVAAAGFGYDDGETSWLENRGGWMFEQHVLQRLSGPINSLVGDVSGDGVADVVSLVSQEWEEIWAFVGDGRGRFTARMLWGSTNPDFGSSWLTMRDLDRDGDADLIYSNGDAFEYAAPNSRPWQGLQWLENRGNLQFVLHRLLDLQGAASPEAMDLDGDGDLDIAVVTSNNDWDDPKAPSLLWLENIGGMRFTRHDVAASPTHLQTLAAGDLDGDGDLDLVTGGMHISRPYDRMGRVTAWFNQRVRTAR